MTYSKTNWRKAMLSVMLMFPEKNWEKQDLINAAYAWLIEMNIPEEPEN